MRKRSIAVVLLLALALAACDPSDNVGAIARASALSLDESARIVGDLRTLAAASAAQGQRTYRGKDIPASLNDLQPIEVVASPKETRIILSGSGDEQVYLLLREKGPDPDGKPHGELVLFKGKSVGSTVWWQD